MAFVAPALIALLVAFAVPVFACALYLMVLTLLSTRRPPPVADEPKLRFDIVVPAHNEERSIASTVTNLSQLDYPPELRRILTVADNCTDETAEAARAAGATVLLRNDATKRGKGYALSFAFERSASDGFADAVIVVDADTHVSPNLLRAFSVRFAAGASAVQARYGVRNPDASWRTRLMAIALAIFHDLRSLGRERLALSCGLRGNGMGFRTALLHEVPHDAFSVVEDVEYGIRLGRKGYRVWYVDEASVLGEMVATEKESRSQRQRWEGGRLKLALAFGPPLLTESMRGRDAVLFDLAMDVLVPPLSYLALATLTGTAVAAVAVALGMASGWVLAPWALSTAFLAAYVSRGVLLSGAGARGFLDLAAAPVYVAWKLALSLRGKRSEEWIRTARASEKTR
jgi:cellulose synthase/poly-beta-1,6-N-acetylglucosamine synthase-like glycosyltransferase